jgi:hypothetical protein
MKRTHELLKEINDLTYTIEKDFPELYQFLDENPITIPNLQHPQLDTKVFAEYLLSLKNLLQNHLDSHKAKLKV